jgi:mono/diheme cytochrome c family protein
VGSSPARTCVHVFILIFPLGPLSQFALAQPKPGSASFMADTAAFRAVASPVRLERGRYLVEGVAHCFECHGQQDFKNKFGQPKPGTKGAGEIVKNEAFDGVPFPDGLVHPNITPDKETGAGTWSDAQFERAIRRGIGHDGRELLDFMPYAFFRSMTDEDVASVIVYIRSMPAVRNALPKRNLPFSVKVNLHPEMEPPLPPDSSEQVKHGWYLVRIAQCNDCHTPNDEHGNPRTDMMFGGGARMKGAWGDVVTPNITPDPSGISHYDEVVFIKTIRTGRASGGVRQLNPLMPYSYFRNMTDDDLKAIFAYLRTIKPVRHHVDNSEPPVYCKLCRQKHGFGDKD